MKARKSRSAVPFQQNFGLPENKQYSVQNDIVCTLRFFRTGGAKKKKREVIQTEPPLYKYRRQNFSFKLCRARNDLKLTGQNTHFQNFVYFFSQCERFYVVYASMFPILVTRREDINLDLPTASKLEQNRTDTECTCAEVKRA